MSLSHCLNVVTVSVSCGWIVYWLVLYSGVKLIQLKLHFIELIETFIIIDQLLINYKYYTIVLNHGILFMYIKNILFAHHLVKYITSVAIGKIKCSVSKCQLLNFG